MEAVTEEEITAKLAEIRDTFDIAEGGRDKISVPISQEGLRWSAQVACGLDRLVAQFNLNGLAYYYRGLDGNDNEAVGSGMIVGNSLLTARGVPAAGEGDLKTAVAMFIMDRLGAGGSFTEFVVMDFVGEFILMGHDGPGHIAISGEKPVLRGLGVFHGKRGPGRLGRVQGQDRAGHHPDHDSDRRRSPEDDLWPRVRPSPAQLCRSATPTHVSNLAWIRPPS